MLGFSSLWFGLKVARILEKLFSAERNLNLVAAHHSFPEPKHKLLHSPQTQSHGFYQFFQLAWSP